MPDTFVCPRCGAVSHHPTDAAEGYCGRCHDWTGGQRRSALATLLEEVVRQLSTLHGRVVELELAIYGDDDPFYIPEERRKTEDVEVKGDLL